MTSDPGGRFAPGTFATPSAPAPVHRMLLSQARMEATLFLRNGEQLLLALVIPIAFLVGLRFLPLGDDAGTPARMESAVAAVLAVAVMASAFTGQAIAVGFDRRYGALKRLGGTPLPPAVIIGGKTLAVAGVVALQCLVLGGLGLALGWRPDALAVLGMIAVVFVGTACFSAMGLLLGGLLRAEIVLALANLVWFAFVGAAGLAVGIVDLPGWLDALLTIVPSYALTEGLLVVQHGGWPLAAFAVLCVWGVASAAVASRTFSFT